VLLVLLVALLCMQTVLLTGSRLVAAWHSCRVLQQRGLEGRCVPGTSGTTR
jgi:hypothetical protein